MNRITHATLTLCAAAALLAACDRPSQLPDMSLSASAISFGVDGSGDPAPQTIQVANTGHGALAPPTAEIGYQDGTGWLTAEVQGAGAPYTVTLHASTASLQPGTYRATVTLTCANAGASPLQVPVTLTVPGPSYALATTGLAFEAPAAGDPAAQRFQVLNGGRGALPVPEVEILYAGTAGAATGWLTASVSGSAAPYTVTLAAHEVAAMPSGIHPATVMIGSAVLGGRRQAVPVTFTLPPQLAVTASLTPFVPAPVDAGPLTQMFTVRNTGRGVLPSPVVAATSDGGWLSAAVQGSAEPYTVVVTADRYRALFAGEYLGTVTVSSPGAPGAPATRVALRVGPPVMNAAGAVAWSNYQGCPLPGAQAVTVTNAGVGFLPRPTVTIPTDATAWLHAEVTGAQAPYQVVLSPIAQPPQASAGATTATVTLGADGASPVQVPVSFTSRVPAITGTRATPSPLVIHAQAGTGDPAPATLSVLTDGGCIPTPIVTYAYGPTEPAWLTWKVATTPQRHDLVLQASTAGMAPGDTRSLSLYVASIASGDNTPVFSQYVSLTLENGGIEPTGALSTARYGHAAVALADGRVLVTGGHLLQMPSSLLDPMVQQDLASAEIYDPAAGTFQPYPALLKARTDHGAVALSDGRVVVCGGEPASRPPYTCEASTGGAWSTIATLKQAHWRPTLIPLAPGKLLVVSRSANSYDYDPPGPDPELVDLATGDSTFVNGGDGTERVVGRGAVRLADGKIMVAGGQGGQTWVYDPAADRWTRTGSMGIGKGSAPPPMLALLPLADGRVLAVGDRNTYVPSTTQVWAPDTGAWSWAGSPRNSHWSGTFAALQNGRVAALGGDASGRGEVELFEPTAGTWSTVAGTSLPRDTGWATVTALPGGRLLIAGGAIGTSSTAAAFTW